MRKLGSRSDFAAPGVLTGSPDLFSCPLPYPLCTPNSTQGHPMLPKAERSSRGSQPIDGKTRPQAGRQNQATSKIKNQNQRTVERSRPRLRHLHCATCDSYFLRHYNTLGCGIKKALWHLANSCTWLPPHKTTSRSLRAMSCTLEYAQKRAPRPNGFTILVSHHPRELMQMREIVDGPCCQKF